MHAQPLVYLAEPIDRGTDNQETMEQVLGLLNQVGATVYRPRTAWNTNGAYAPWYPIHNAHTMWLVNERARRNADLVVAVVAADSNSIGVPAELALSIEERGRVAVVIGGQGQVVSWVMAAWDYQLRQTGKGGVFQGTDGMEEFQQWLLSD